MRVMHTLVCLYGGFFCLGSMVGASDLGKLSYGSFKTHQEAPNSRALLARAPKSRNSLFPALPTYLYEGPYVLITWYLWGLKG